MKPESFSFLDDEPDIFAARPGLEPFGTARFYRHVPHPSPDGLAEVGSLFDTLLCMSLVSMH